MTAQNDAYSGVYLNTGSGFETGTVPGVPWRFPEVYLPHDVADDIMRPAGPQRPEFVQTCQRSPETDPSVIV